MSHGQASVEQGFSENNTVGEFHCDGRTVQRGKQQILGDSLI